MEKAGKSLKWEKTKQNRTKKAEKEKAAGGLFRPPAKAGRGGVEGGGARPPGQKAVASSSASSPPDRQAAAPARRPQQGLPFLITSAAPSTIRARAQPTASGISAPSGMGRRKSGADDSRPPP